MKLKKDINERVLLFVIMFSSIIACFTQKVWVRDNPTPQNYPFGVTAGLFNEDGGINMYILDTVYRANMTFLLGKKTLHPFIVVDIDKANIPYNISEKDLMKSPYCYLSIATQGYIYLDYMCSVPDSPIAPIGSVGDTIIDFGNWGFFDVLESKEWTLYTPIQYINKKELKNPYKNFYVMPFDQPTDKAVLCMMKAKLINRYTGVIAPHIDYISTDPSRPLTPEQLPKSEYIEPYKFENEEVFYKVLFPYADK